MGRRASSFLFRLPRLSSVAMWLLPLTLGACSSSTRPAPAATTAKATNAAFLNGWRSGHDPRDLAKTWYLTPQGSYLLDFDVFMSLPSVSDQAPLFSDRASLESYGFLYPDNYEEGGKGSGELSDTGGLPVGVVKDTRGEGHTPLAKQAKELTRDYVGVTGAA